MAEQQIASPIAWQTSYTSGKSKTKLGPTSVFEERGKAMALGKILRAGLPGVLLRWGGRLRFPYLFLLTAVFFVLDLLIPDVIPLADEIIIGMVTMLFASLKKTPLPPEEPAAAENEG